MAGLAYYKDTNDPSAAADDYYCMKYPEQNKTITISKVLNRHGFKNVKAYSLGYDTHRTKCYLGINDVIYRGKRKQIIAVVIKGTNGSANEWSSNFDMGSGVPGAVDSHKEWSNVKRHKGFDIAASRVYEKINDYYDNYANKKIQTAYWVTGHSRGAAISNIVSAKLIDNSKQVYAYTFATPNTTTSSNRKESQYGCIFNTVNERDFVTTVPCTGWGFGRYGKTAIKSMSDSMKTKWNANMRCYYSGNKKALSYNEMSKKHLDGLVSSLEDIMNGRSSLYNCSSSNQSITIKSNDLYKNGKISTDIMPQVMKKQLDMVNGYRITSINSKN